MNRTALRWSILAALTHGGTAPYPTMAGEGVFDSRQDAIVDLEPDERAPAIVIRTGEDRRISSTQSGVATGRRMQRSCEVTIEIGAVEARKVESSDGEMIDVAAWAESDAQLEAMLDLLEHQVEAALRGNSEWASWFRGMQHGFGITDWSSQPIWTDPERSRVRLAAREIQIGFWMANDCLPKARIEGDAAPPSGVPAGVLAEVLARIDAKGGGDVKAAAAQLAAMLAAAAWPAGMVAPALTTVGYTIPEPGTPPSGEAEAALVSGDLLQD